MKKIIYISLLITTLFSLSACNNWLDISPKGQVEAKDLLTDTKGYNAAINGVYYIMTSDKLYGKELTFGVMDVYAHYWNVLPTNVYGKAIAYEREYTKTYSTDFWTEMYKAIGQCNQILDAHKVTGANIENSNLFKGEALGLRGFLHFELLKMFGPVIKSAADYGKTAIPYRKNYDNIAIKFSSVSEVLDLVRADLTAALAEFENDPINVDGRAGNGNKSSIKYNSVIDRRGNRMNVWAVKATLARLEMLAGRKDKALIYCEEIIEKATIFKFNKELNNSIDYLRDLICSDELIFALYANNHFKTTAETFGFDNVEKLSNKHLLINKDNHENIKNNIYGRTPDGSGADFRLKFWFASISGDYQDFVKLRTAKVAGGMDPAFLPEISLIKLSEIYYMAAECLVGINNTKAMSYINKVRVNRGLAEMDGVVTDSDVETNIFREYKKEFFGDGILFGYYKRHNKNIEKLNGSIIPVTDDIFVFQIPDEEYEFSPNEKPSVK